MPEIALLPPDPHVTPDFTMFMGTTVYSTLQVLVEEAAAPTTEFKEFEDPVWAGTSTRAIWMVLSDTRMIGWSPDHEQEPWYMDLRVPPHVVEAITLGWTAVLKAGVPHGYTSNEPIALYRGASSGDFMALRDTGWHFPPVPKSQGAYLGDGVYLVSPWKAVARAREGHEQFGYVVRVLVLPRVGADIRYVVDVDEDPDPESTDTLDPVALDPSEWVTRVIKHALHPFGNAGAGDVVVISPICLGERPHDGAPIWAVRNEEWCVRDPSWVHATVWAQVRTSPTVCPLDRVGGWSHNMLVNTLKQ